MTGVRSFLSLTQILHLLPKQRSYSSQRSRCRFRVKVNPPRITLNRDGLTRDPPCTACRSRRKFPRTGRCGLARASRGRGPCYARRGSGGSFGRCGVSWEADGPRLCEARPWYRWWRIRGSTGPGTFERRVLFQSTGLVRMMVMM